MKRMLSIYFTFIKMHIREQMMYRMSFFAGVVGQAFSYGVQFLMIHILTSSFGTLAGWKPEEVLFMYAFSLLSYGLGAACFYWPSNNLVVKVRTGEFDNSLTKPISPFLYEMFSGFSAGYITHITLSVVVLVITIQKTSFQVSVGNIALLLFLLICSAMMQGAFLLISAVPSFFTVNQNPVLDFLLWDIKKFVDYPITIYGGVIQVLLSFVLPYAFLAFYPASWLLGKENLTILPDFVQYLAPVISILFFAVTLKLWHFGLSRYQSTGS